MNFLKKLQSLLLAPLHYGEMHYKKHYHLRFVHARKLFLFDILLVSTMFVLGGATVFWNAYKPEITDQVVLSITPSGEKFKSGENYSLTIQYKNTSKIKLVDPVLTIHLPTSFAIDSAEPAQLFSTSSVSFTLENLVPNQSGEAKIQGRFFGLPDESIHISAGLRYRQENRSDKEEKMAALISIPRGSTIETSVNLPKAFIGQGNQAATISIKNTGGSAVALAVPLSMPSGIVVKSASAESGEVKNGVWNIPNLETQMDSTLTLQLETNLPKPLSVVDMSITPEVVINSTHQKQTMVNRRISVIHPEVAINTEWTDTKSWPGEIQDLNVSLTNNGTTALKNLIVSVPFPASLIDTKKITDLNHAVWRQDTLVLDQQFRADFVSLAPNQSIKLTVQIPVSGNPVGGTNLTLAPKIRLRAELPEIPEAIYETTTESPALPIGTLAKLLAETRYYTNEGDQLGRGPLPPRVGKETKYWAMVTITNGSNDIAEALFTAKLPGTAQWTGKTSVSLGRELTYDPITRIVRWTAPLLSAYETAGVYFEISFTPTTAQIGTSPLILVEPAFTGRDLFIDEIITKHGGKLDTSLVNDKIAQEKGVNISP